MAQSKHLGVQRLIGRLSFEIIVFGILPSEQAHLEVEHAQGGQIAQVLELQDPARNLLAAIKRKSLDYIAVLSGLSTPFVTRRAFVD